MKILQWYPKGIRNKKGDLNNLINFHDIFIVCISESHLIKSSKFSIPNYNKIRADRPLRRGIGLLFSIKQNIKFKILGSILTNSMDFQIYGIHFYNLNISYFIIHRKIELIPNLDLIFSTS